MIIHLDALATSHSWVYGYGVDDEFKGYEPAARYLGLSKHSLRAYVLRGIGPEVARREPDRQYIRPVFTRAELDRWQRERPGQGARSDLRR